MSLDLLKISALSTAPDPLGGAEEIPGNQAGITYKLLSRMFMLPSDPILTYQDVHGSLPGSRPLTAGVGITIVADATKVLISASSAGQLLILNLALDAVLAASQEDWNPAGWDGGNNLNRLQVTPSAATLLGGLDSSNAQDGQVIALMNEDPANLLRMAHNSAGSLPANRFLCPGGATYALAPYQAVLIMKKGTTGWRFI